MTEKKPPFDNTSFDKTPSLEDSSAASTSSTSSTVPTVATDPTMSSDTKAPPAPAAESTDSSAQTADTPSVSATGKNNSNDATSAPLKIPGDDTSPSFQEVPGSPDVSEQEATKPEHDYLQKPVKKEATLVWVPQQSSGDFIPGGSPAESGKHQTVTDNSTAEPHEPRRPDAESGNVVADAVTEGSGEVGPDDRLPNENLPDERLPDERLPDERLSEGLDTNEHPNARATSADRVSAKSGEEPDAVSAVGSADTADPANNPEHNSADTAGGSSGGGSGGGSGGHGGGIAVPSDDGADNDDADDTDDTDDDDSPYDSADDGDEEESDDSEEDEDDEEEEEEDEKDGPTTLREHLLELRRRVFFMFLWAMAGFALCFPFATEIFNHLMNPMIAAMEVAMKMVPTAQGSDVIELFMAPMVNAMTMAIESTSPTEVTDIYNYLIQPMMHTMIQAVKGAEATHTTATLIYTAPSEAFFTEMKVAFVGGLFVMSPMIFYQVWRFVAPGLYREEKIILLPLAFSSGIFFIAGGAFCYIVAFPTVFKFFMSYNSASITAMPSLKESLSFALQFMVAFGVVFEMPLFTFFLARLGLVTGKMMRSFWRYSIIIILVVAAVLTPPDVISQCLMAGPMLLLYILSIVIAEIFGKKTLPEETEDGDEDNEAQT